jgi:hypothetical protein
LQDGWYQALEGSTRARASALQRLDRGEAGRGERREHPGEYPDRHGECDPEQEPQRCEPQPGLERPGREFVITTPTRQPTVAPRIERVVDSTMNCSRIARSEAPIALRRPISYRRSAREILSTE